MTTAPFQLHDPTALPGFAVRLRKHLETLESLDHYCRKLLLTRHPCARKALCSSYTSHDNVCDADLTGQTQIQSSSGVTTMAIRIDGPRNTCDR